jgi:hypothetical protein
VERSGADVGVILLYSMAWVSRAQPTDDVGGVWRSRHLEALSQLEYDAGMRSPTANQGWLSVPSCSLFERVGMVTL